MTPTATYFAAMAALWTFELRKSGSPRIVPLVVTIVFLFAAGICQHLGW